MEGNTVRVVLASHNMGKLAELREMLGDVLELVSAEVPLPVEGTLADGATFYSNARLKAETVARAAGGWALADDSGLEVAALGGLPGVDSASYGGWERLLAALRDVGAGGTNVGPGDGFEAGGYGRTKGSAEGRGEGFPGASGGGRAAEAFGTDGSDFNGIVSGGGRGATFRCVLALAHPGRETRFFEGVCEGVIAPESRGELGFAYDPVFIPLGETRTFGEMSSAEKARFSHRARAVEALRKALAAGLDGDA